jgi:glyoxylase-like metal-dependent hydrolase (beta-lactamase superfamily II)
MGIVISKVTVGEFKENCYLISDQEEAWLIDPGDDVNRVISILDLEKYKLKGIINTHGHFDHIGAVAEIKDKYGIPFYIHSNDRRLVTQGNLYRRMLGQMTIYRTPTIDGYLDDLDFLDLKNNKIFIHHTPGHTNGGVCFEVDGNLIAGDMLLKRSFNLLNLPGENKELMVNSINYIFENFKGHTVYPGHGNTFVLDEVVLNEFYKE